MPQQRDPLCYQLSGVCTAGFDYELRTPAHGARNQVQLIEEIVAMNEDHDKTICDVGIYDGRAILWVETRQLPVASYWYRLHGDFSLLTNQCVVVRWRTETYDTEPQSIEGDRIHVNIFGCVLEPFTTP